MRLALAVPVKPTPFAATLLEKAVISLVYQRFDFLMARRGICHHAGPEAD